MSSRCNEIHDHQVHTTSTCIAVIELVLCAGASAVQPAALTLQPHASSSDSQAHGES